MKFSIYCAFVCTRLFRAIIDITSVSCLHIMCNGVHLCMHAREVYIRHAYALSETMQNIVHKFPNTKHIINNWISTETNILYCVAILTLKFSNPKMSSIPTEENLSTPLILPLIACSIHLKQLAYNAIATESLESSACKIWASYSGQKCPCWKEVWSNSACIDIRVVYVWNKIW